MNVEKVGWVGVRLRAITIVFWMYKILNICINVQYIGDDKCHSHNTSGWVDNSEEMLSFSLSLSTNKINILLTVQRDSSNTRAAKSLSHDNI